MNNQLKFSSKDNYITFGKNVKFHKHHVIGISPILVDEQHKEAYFVVYLKDAKDIILKYASSSNALSDRQFLENQINLK
jgi:predicted nucleic acid-binding Zn finger protein